MIVEQILLVRAMKCKENSMEEMHTDFNGKVYTGNI